MDISQPKLSSSGAWELDVLECTICYAQMRDVGTPVTQGEECGHNFCQDCLSAHVQRAVDLKMDAQCPICRRVIVGIQRNKLATRMIAHFVASHGALLEEQQLAQRVVADLQRQLAQSKELESSATQVNNLLRQKLESLQQKLDRTRKELKEAKEAAAVLVHHSPPKKEVLVPPANVDNAVREQDAHHQVHQHDHQQDQQGDQQHMQHQEVRQEDSPSNSMSMSTIVDRFVAWARPAPTSANQFTLDLRQRFDVKERRGASKMSPVYRGVDRENGKDVALKSLRRAADVRELMLLTKMRHRSVVHCDAIALGTGSVACAVLSPFVQADLEFAVKAGKIPVANAQLVVRQLLDAVAYMHSAQVAHNNICPTAVLVDLTGDAVSVLLAGFSFAYSVLGPATVPRRVARRTSFSAPEWQEEGYENGLASDLWSVGAIARFVVSANPPTDDVFQSFCAQSMHVDPSQRTPAAELVEHPWIVKDAAAKALGRGSQARNDARQLAFELQDTCIQPFARTFGGKVLQDILALK